MSSSESHRSTPESRTSVAEVPWHGQNQVTSSGQHFQEGKGDLYGHPTEKLIVNTELLHNAMPNTDVQGKASGICFDSSPTCTS